jgi:hypothetical protein
MKKATTKRKARAKKDVQASFTANPVGTAMDIFKNFSEADYQAIAATAIAKIKDVDYRKMAKDALKDVDYKQVAKDTLKVVVPLIVMKIIYSKIKSSKG